MSDIECPYCGQEQEICHDDGHGYEEDRKHEQTCHACSKRFVFTTAILYHYSPAQADCLNDGEHQWSITKTYPRRYANWRCDFCGETKPLTETEMQVHIAGAKP